jgi:uncharacterized membrane protein YdjX (TVP38/TMEM64 family)
MNSKKKFVIFLSFIIVCVAVSVFSGYLGLNPTTIQNYVSVNNTLFAVIYTIAFVILASLSFSISVMSGLGIFFFSVKETIVYSLIGIMGGAIVHFYMSRRLGKKAIQDYIEKRGGRLEEFENIFKKDPSKTVLLLSAIFIVPPTIPNCLGGILNISLKKYSIATLLGNIPNTILTVCFLDGISTGNTAEVYFCIIGLILVTVISMLFYRGEIKSIFRLSFPWLFKKIN